MEHLLFWIVIAACAMLFLKVTKNVIKILISVIVIAAIVAYVLPMLGIA